MMNEEDIKKSFELTELERLQGAEETAQAIHKGKIKSNLIPEDIDRLIARKKGMRWF